MIKNNKDLFKSNKFGNNVLEVRLLRKNKKISNKKNAIYLFIFFILIWISGFFMYNTYQGIEIDRNSYVATKTQSTIEEQTVEKAQEKSKNVADVLEDTNEKVVGISKLKNAGSSIFSKSTENELGLGTGFIVSQDGYIVSNEHVTGSKYSKCYITLENGSNYEGTVVWSDSDLDLSITKIEARNLPYATLGDSKNIRIGESVYAIRKSYTDMNLEEL